MLWLNCNDGEPAPDSYSTSCTAVFIVSILPLTVHCEKKIVDSVNEGQEVGLICGNGDGLFCGLSKSGLVLTRTFTKIA